MLRSTDFRRPRSAGRWTGGVSAGLVVSLVAHAVVGVTLGVTLGGSTHRAPPTEAAYVDVAPPENVAGEVPAAKAAAPMARASAPTSVHRSRQRSAPSPGSSFTAPSTLGESSEERPRFALAAGTVASRGSGVAAGAVSQQPGGGATSLDALPEGAVDVAARLISTSPLVYPPAARQAEIEADLPVEIVIEIDGRVSSARVLTRAGYGLDEAALRAVRLYRFSPALRAGLPVRVRMRWTMQFRLR